MGIREGKWIFTPGMGKEGMKIFSRRRHEEDTKKRREKKKESMPG